MPEHDELAELLDEIAFIVRKADRTERLLWDDVVRAASAVRTAGYRKLRTITMLRDVPIETVVRDAAGNFYERAFADEPGSWVTMGDVALFNSSDLKFPVTVIWEPSGK